MGLANPTIQQRLVALGLFDDYLIEEGRRDNKPGRASTVHTRGRLRQPPRQGLVPRFTKLSWIPTNEQWQALLKLAGQMPVRNRLMLASANDAALRREELCSLRTDDCDPAHRTMRVRVETTKSRRERVVPYSSAPHTLRHLCLTDPVRCGWELHEIAGFAGHRSTATARQYIHLSGRDLPLRTRLLERLNDVATPTAPQGN